MNQMQEDDASGDHATPPPALVTIEGLLGALSSKLVSARREVIERIIEAAKRYGQTGEALEVAKAAVAIGFEPQTTDLKPFVTDDEKAAQALYDLVATLPGLPASRQIVSVAVPSPSVPPPPPAPPAVSSEQTSSPASEALRLEFLEIDWNALRGEHFRLMAQLFACRARQIQEVERIDPTLEGPLTRIIKTLTAKMHEKQAQGIYGLSRKHVGPWERRVTDAQAALKSLST